MEIGSIRHKGLRQFFLTGTTKGLVGDANRLRKMLFYMDEVESFAELATPPNFGLHALTGDRKATWSMTVTRNWRLTFQIAENGSLIELDLEDYHGT